MKRDKKMRASPLALAIGTLMVAPGALAYDTAAATTAANGSACNAARPFYWEIGGQTGSPIVSGQVGGTTYSRTTEMDLASASKWITAAYVLERYNGLPGGSAGADIVDSMQMLKGHTSFNELWCEIVSQVGNCHTISNNDVVDSSKVGDFNYNSGDMQWVAASSNHLDLGDLYRSGLASEIDSYLALGSTFNAATPLLAGGYNMNTVDYAQFLQRLMTGYYVMTDYLGYNPVATVCSNCFSPLNTANLHYSLFHWIEDQTGGYFDEEETYPAGVGDGVYSSPGAFGYYPWITADKNYYGIVARRETAGSWLESVVCGQAIRDAFFN